MESSSRQGMQGAGCTSDSDDDDDARIKNAKLFAAIHDDELDKVIALLDQGVKTDSIDKNNKNNTPLHYAVEKGKIEIIKELLNPRWKTNIKLKNSKGKTPLHIAFKRNNREIMQLLLSHRAKVGDNVENKQGILVVNSAGQHKTAVGDSDADLLSKVASDKPSTSFKQLMSEISNVMSKPTCSSKELRSEISNSPPNTVEFVKNALKDVILVEENDARRLAKELSYLPVPVRLAVAYIKVENQKLKNMAKRKFTITNYLKEFQKRAGKFLNKWSCRNLSKGSEISKIAWKVTVDKIEHNEKKLGELAIFMLNVMAHLAPDDIPVDEIFPKEIFGEKERRDAVKLLEQYSIVQLDGRIASIDSLIQKEIKMEIERQGRNEELIEKTFRLLRVGFMNFGDEWEYVAETQRLLKHSEAFLSYIDEWLKNKPKKRKEIEEKVIGDLLVLMSLDYKFNEERTRQLLERALNICKRKFGNEHLEVAFILARLGYSYQNLRLANQQKAKELLEQALVMAEETLGPENLLVGEILSNLSSTYGFLGQVNKQKELLERAVLILENLNAFDPFRFFMAFSYHRHANLTLKNPHQKLGNFLMNRAQKLVQALDKLGGVFRELGDAPKAKELQERALAIAENTFGPENKLAANVLSSLSDTYGVISDTQKQKVLLEKALAITEKYYGPDHFEAAVILGKLARVFGELGDAPKAIEWQERALALQKKHFGPDHFEVAATLSNLGCTYAELGDCHKNRDLQEQALAMMVNAVGPQHFLLVPLLVNLSNAYAQLGDARKQKEKLELALEIEEEYHGPDSCEVAETLERLGDCYLKFDDASTALNFFQRALTIHEKYYGRDHYKVGDIMNGLSTAYGALGNGQKRKELLERTLAIEEKHYGKNHVQVAIILANLGDAHGVLGDVKTQTELQERALLIMENRYGPSHFHLVKLLSHLGHGYRVLGDFQKNRNLQERALKIAENNFGPEHFQVAQILAHLSSACGDLGDEEKQAELFKRAAEIRHKIKETYPHEYPQTRAILSKACLDLQLPQLTSVFPDAAFSEKSENTVPNKNKIAQEGLSLYMAFEKGSLESITALLEGGLDVLARDNHGTVLHKAVSSNNKKIIKLILNKIKEKDPKNFTKHINSEDCFGDTPLMWAAQNGRTEAAKELLAHGADINAKNHKGETALFWATRGRFEKLKQLLLNETKN